MLTGIKKLLKRLDLTPPSPTRRGKSHDLTVHEVAHPSISPETIVVEQKTEKTETPQLAKDFKTSQKEITKNVSDNPAVANSYTLTPANTVPGHNQPLNDISDSDAKKAWHFFLIGLLGYLISSVLILNNNNASSASLGLLFFIPGVLFIISIMYCFKAIIAGHHGGLILCIILDLLFLLVSTFQIIVAFTP
jgi:hypothetical protein